MYVRTLQPPHRRDARAPRTRPGALGGNEGQSYVEISSRVGQGDSFSMTYIGERREDEGVCRDFFIYLFFSMISPPGALHCIGPASLFRSALFDLYTCI